MDSRELFDLLHPWDRATQDQQMAEIFGWVQRAVPPEYVYGREQLREWAMRNGWRQDGNDAELCALLKQANAYVVVGTPLSVAINDAITARRTLWG